MNKGRERQRKKEKKKKIAPIHTSSHDSKIHVLWLNSQEPGYYAKKSCILESHQLGSSGQVKPMCPTVMIDNLSPKGCSQGKYLWHLHSFSGLWSNETLLGWEPWLHGYCGEHSDYETMRRRKSPWQRWLLSLISTLNVTHAPVDSFMLSTSLSNCPQHQEGQGGKVSIEYTMLAGSLHIWVVLGSALTSPCKTYRWFSWCICLSTFPWAHCLWWSILYDHLHARCWRK